METEPKEVWSRVARRWAGKCDWTMEEAYQFLLSKAVVVLARAIFLRKRRRRKPIRLSSAP